MDEAFRGSQTAGRLGSGDAEGTDRTGESGELEAERVEVGASDLLAECAVEVRQQVAQRLNALRPGLGGRLFTEEEAEIVLQAAIERIDDGQIDDFAGSLALGNRSGIRIRCCGDDRLAVRQGSERGGRRRPGPASLR